MVPWTGQYPIPGYVPPASDMLLTSVSQLRSKLPEIPILSRLLGPILRSGDNNNVLSNLTESWIYLTIFNFVTAKIRHIYDYFDPVNKLLNSVFLESTHDSCDASYTWLMHFWKSHPRFSNARDFVTTIDMSVDGSMDPWGGRRFTDGPDQLMVGPAKQDEPVAPKFWPKFQARPFWFVHARTLFRISRRAMGVTGDTWHGSSIVVRCFSRSKVPLVSLLQEARSIYIKNQQKKPTVQLMVFDEILGAWQETVGRRSRSLESIIMDEELKTSMLADVREFLRSADWYHERGIGFRRGKLDT